MVAIVVPVQFDETNESGKMEVHTSPLFLTMVQMESEKKYESAWRTNSVPVLNYPNCYPTICRPHKLHARACVALITPVTPPSLNLVIHCPITGRAVPCPEICGQWSSGTAHGWVWRYTADVSRSGVAPHTYSPMQRQRINSRFWLAPIGYCRLRWGNSVHTYYGSSSAASRQTFVMPYE